MQMKMFPVKKYETSKDNSQNPDEGFGDCKHMKGM